MTIALAVTPTSPHPELTLSKTWHNATWNDYVALRDDESIEFNRISFHKTSATTGWLWADPNGDGIAHSECRDLMTMVIACWAMENPGNALDSLGRCLMLRPDTHAASPDLILYRGGDRTIRDSHERRWLDLSQHRIPDLVGEISETSLHEDLTEHKCLYESLQIPEYWVIDVENYKMLAFCLNEAGHYQPCTDSQVLPGLPIALLDQTIAQLKTCTNTAAANWFRKQLTSLR